MARIIGVRFRTAGKIYYFDPLRFSVKRGDHVIVETARGVEYGTVVGEAVSYTHLTLPTTSGWCRSRWSPYH